MFDISKTTSDLEESVNTLQNIANFFSPENLSKLFTYLIIILITCNACKKKLVINKGVFFSLHVMV